jgi:membrane protein implicated in regulation of membrane protease activity
MVARWVYRDRLAPPVEDGTAQEAKPVDVTIAFLIIGGCGLLLLAASIGFGAHVHLGHLHEPLHWHVGHGGHDGSSGSDAAFSLPSVAGFIGAFGFGGAVAAQLFPGRSVTMPVLIGVGCAVPTAWAWARLTRAAMNMSTDATPTQFDVIGSLGVVIRAIPDDGYGEVRLSFAGQLMKFHARAAAALPVGTEILVVDAPSTTSVVVEMATSLLG